MKNTMNIYQTKSGCEVIGYDEKHIKWSVDYYKTLDEAIKETQKVLKRYKRENYKIVFQGNKN